MGILILCWLFYITVIPGTVGGLIAALSRTRQATRFLCAMLTILCLEVILIFVLQANPIIRFDRNLMSSDAAAKIVAYAKEQGLGADDFGGADIGKYTVNLYYRLSVLNTGDDVIAGDIEIKSFPFGERHGTLFYYVPSENIALSHEEYQNFDFPFLIETGAPK
jgi:hypothetical protein